MTAGGEQNWGANGDVDMEECECCEGICGAWRLVTQ